MRAMPMVAVNPYYDALHLGGLLVVLAGSAALYWLLTLAMSRRARSLTPLLRTVLLGAVFIDAGYFLPWAQVASRHFSLTLFGGDFAGAFGAAALTAVALAIFLGACLTPVWESYTLRMGLGAVVLGAGVGAGFLGMELLRPDHTQIVATFAQHGPAVLSSARHISLAEASGVIARFVSSGSLRVTDSFGPYVVVAGAVLVTAAAVLNLAHQLRTAIAGRGQRAWAASRGAEGGPLARGRSGSHGAVPRLPGPRISPRRPKAVRSSQEPAPVSQLGKGQGATDTVPPAPPMPGTPEHTVDQGRPHLDSNWSARRESSRRLRRLRSR